MNCIGDVVDCLEYRSAMLISAVEMSYYAYFHFLNKNNDNIVEIRLIINVF